MEINNNFEDLFVSYTSKASAEEIALASLQALLAAEISMKRQDLGMSQKQFAELMGVTQALVSKWESGNTNFTLSTLVNIASKLKIKIQLPFVTEAPRVYSAANIHVSKQDDWSNITVKPALYSYASVGSCVNH